MNISLLQKRLLIIWILFHSFGLIVNLLNIRGNIKEGNGYSESTINLFTSNSYDDDFYPFTTYRETNTYYKDTSYVSNKGFMIEKLVKDPDGANFYGVFNSYGFPEFIFYILLGLVVIFVPKIWN